MLVGEILTNPNDNAVFTRGNYYVHNAHPTMTLQKIDIAEELVRCSQMDTVETDFKSRRVGIR
jgi:hypothetical protein